MNDEGLAERSLVCLNRNDLLMWDSVEECQQQLTAREIAVS